MMFDNCKNVNVQAMLVPYVERVLAATNRAEVEEHLHSCDECRHRVSVIRETLKAMSDLAREGYKPSLERHLSSGQLFVYALERGRMIKPEVMKIHNHVSSCPICAAEVAALQQIDSKYQERVITVGTSDLVPALKRSRVPSSSGSFECVPPAIPVATARPNFWDYYHLISHRVNLPRVISAFVVLLVLIFALSSAFRGDEATENKLENIADKTADAIASLPSPSASAISVNISVEEGQTDQLCYLLQSNDIPFERAEGKVRIPADFVAKAQQLWTEAVERSQTSSATYSDENRASEIAPESVPYEESSYAQDAPAESSSSSYAEPIAEAVTSAPVDSSDNYNSSTSYNAAPAVSVSAEPRSAYSAPKPILRPLHQSAPSSSSSNNHRIAPQSSANRPHPKPAIVTPTAAPAVSASVAVEKEVSSNVVQVAPQVVRMGVVPSVGNNDYDDAQAVTPTPRSIYEGSGADDNSGIGSWSNDL